MGTLSIGDAVRDLKQRIERPTDVWGWEQMVAERDAKIERLEAALDIARTGLLRIERQSEEVRAQITRAVT